MWLRDYHIDGLRYDMTAYMRSVDGRGDDLPDGWSLMREINEAIRAEFPGRILIAEDLRGESHLSSTGPDGAHFHAQWDPGFVHPVRRAATTPFDGDRSLAEVRDAVFERLRQQQPEASSVQGDLFGGEGERQRWSPAQRRAGEKLINELGWRDYWQRLWIQLGDGIWIDREPLKTGHAAQSYTPELPADLASASTGLSRKARTE